MRITIAKLAKRLGANPDKIVSGSSDVLSKEITGVGPVMTAGENEVTFVSSEKHKAALAGSGAGAVIVPECIEGLDKPQLVVANVNAALIKVLNTAVTFILHQPPSHMTLCRPTA